MLDNRNPRAEQQRVRGTRAVLRVINIHRINSDQRRRGLDQQLGGASSHEGSALVVLRRAPMRIPASANQYGPVPQIQTLKIPPINRATVSPGRVYHQTFDISQPFKRQSAQINSTFEPVERRVNVGSSVGDHLDAVDLKRRALGISAARSLA